MITSQLNNINKAFILSLILILASCYGGLEPGAPSSKSTLTGTAIFVGGKGEWPARDSIKDMRIVLFKSYPPKDIITEVLSGNAVYSFDALPFFVDSCRFSFDFATFPLEFKYIVTAWRYGDSLLKDWRVVGVYTESGDNTKPSPIKIEQGRNYEIRINIDFKNLPPQPF